MTSKGGKTQDALVEMAKDLLMLDRSSLLELNEVTPTTPKEKAFREFAVSIFAARRFAEQFRQAHLAEIREEHRSWDPASPGADRTVERVMGQQFQEELQRVDGLEREEIAARRAS